MASNHRTNVTGVLRGVLGETRHVCWQCPACGAWYSDDYELGLDNPYRESCGRTRHHAHGNVIPVSVSWSQEMTDADLEKRYDDLDRQFDSNIADITICAEKILANSSIPDEVIEFYDWFFMWSKRTIPKNYPQWLSQFTVLAKLLENPAYSNHDMAKVARLIFELIDDISYGGTEEHHVQKTREILDLLRGISVQGS